MKINSINYMFQTTGMFSGSPQIIVDCAFDNTNLTEDVGEPTDLTKEVYKDKLKKCSKKLVHSVSFQGGEPLLQIDSLKELLKPKRTPVLIKTNGSLPNHLLEIVEKIDFLELVYHPGFDDAFLESVSVAQLVSQSAVVYPFLNLNREEVTRIAQLVSTVNVDIPFIIQPSMKYTSKQTSSDDDIVKCFNYVQQSLAKVLVVPDTKNLFQGLVI
jgi:pyruvate-formate lyase-activating enzyme